MKSKEITKRLFVMLAMAVVLAVATLAWFVNSTNTGAEGIILGAAPLKVSATLEEYYETPDGTPTYGEARPFDSLGNIAIKIDNIVPGQKKIYRIVVKNEGQSANVSLGVNGIELGKYLVYENGSSVEKQSELDKPIFYKLEKTQVIPVIMPDKSIFDQRRGATTIGGTLEDMAPDAINTFYAVFLYDPLATEFSDGTLALNFGVVATLK